MTTGTVEGGMAITTKSVKWRLNNFAQIFTDQELVRQLWMTFDVTSSTGVTSKWMLSMDFLEVTQDPTTNGPGSSNKAQYLTLFVSLVSTSNGQPFVNAKFDVEFEGKDGLSFYKLSPGGSTWYEAGKFYGWHILSMPKNEDIGHLLTPEGTVLVKLEATIYDVLGQTPNEAGLGPEKSNGNLPDMVPMIVQVPTEPHPQLPNDLYSQMAQVSENVQGRVRALKREIQIMKGRAEASGVFRMESRACLDHSIDQLDSKSVLDLNKEASELRERNRRAISALENEVTELMNATGCPPVPDTPPKIIDLCSSDDENQGEDERNPVTPPTPKETETSATSAPCVIPAPPPNSKESVSAVIPAPLVAPLPPPTPKESETSVTPVTPTPEKTSATMITPELATGSGSASAAAAPKNRMNRQDLLAYMDMVETCKLAVPATGPESTQAKANADPSPPPVTSTTMTSATAPTEPVKATAPSTAAVNSDRPRTKRPLSKAEEKFIRNPPKLQLTRLSADAIARLSRPMSQPPPPGASGAAKKRRAKRNLV